MRSTQLDRFDQVLDSPALRVHLFGELDVRMGERRLAPLESARARSLLAYLLLHVDAPNSRQRLSFLLWPDSTEAQARTNLRKVLHTLRGEIPELERFLQVTPRSLRWRPEEPYWVDVAAFESALAEAEGAGAGPQRAIAALRTAVDLYRGDLLEGIFDEWLVEERERLRDHYQSALRRLSSRLAQTGEHAEAIRLGRELLRCNPLHEDTYRLLMSMHNAADDRAAAVRVYHECVTTLQRELGVDPSTTTTQLYAALMRSGHPQPAISADEEPIRVSGAALVGRNAEWEQVTRYWWEAQDGRPQLVLVTGEAGVGKTRLVEELTGWCAHLGAVVAQARSYPTEGDLGYGVVISWLRTAELAPQLRRAAPSDRAELARLLPELGNAAASATQELDAAEQRRKLFEAVANTLAAPDRTTLLVADDAQWCDPQSLQLIHYLVRHDPSSTLMVVATVRRDDLDEGHPLTALFGGLQIIDRATEIPLDRLSRGDTEKLARHLAGGDMDSVSVDHLHAETEGNPLFIVEMIRAGGAGERLPLTPKLQAVIATRLRQISGPARDLLGVAATVGREFTSNLVRKAWHVDELTLARGLDELWRRGIIREHGNDAYDFTHGKLRDVAYEALNPATRRRNHLLIAEALRELHEANPGTVSGQVARNYDHAGHVDDAVAWYQLAAVQAQRLHANAEAVRLLDRASELVAALPEGDDRLTREFEILSALPTPLGAVEGFASSRLTETQRRAIEVANILGVDPEPPLLRSVVLSSLCGNDFDTARRIAGQLHDEAERAGDEGLLIETDYLLGIAAFWGGALEAARVHFEQAVRRFRSEQRGEHLLRFGQDPRVVCLSRLANTLWFLGRPDEARRAREQAVAMATEAGHPFSRSIAYIFAALLSLDLDEHDHVRAYAAALSQERDQARPNEIKTSALVGLAKVLEGGTADGMRRIRAAVELCGPVNHAPGFRVALMRVLLAAHHAAGDAEGGIKTADEALLLDGSRIWEAEMRRLRAEFLASLGGDPAEVEAELARAAEVARRQGARGLERRVEHSRSRIRLVN